MIKKRNPDICLLNETHITDEINNTEIKISGYNLMRCNSYSNRTGGVNAYVKKEIQTKNMNVYNSELMWLLSFDIKSQIGVITICGVYLSSDLSKKKCTLDEFEKWSESTIIENNIIITGDFNVNFLSESADKIRLKQICEDMALKQIVTSETRLTNRSKTMIDLCFSNMRKTEVNVLDEDQISDHANVEIVMKCSMKNANANKYRTIKVTSNYCYENVINEVENWCDQWAEVEHKNVDDKVDWLLNNLTLTASKFTREKSIKCENEFFDSHLEAMRLHKNILYKNAQYAESDNEMWKEYKCYKNYYKSEITKKRYECTQRKLEATNGDQKRTWKVLKSMLNNESNDITYIVNENNVIIEKEEEIANEFNKYFVESVKKINKEIVHIDYRNNISFTPINTFEFKETRISDIKRLLRDMKKKESRDYCDISANLLTDSFDLTGVFITDIINKSFESGVFPTLLKKSVVVPIQKIPATHKITEYRPINTLLCLEKLIEKSAYSQLNQFVVDNKILSEVQSGFREAHSCETTINNVINEWKVGLEKGETTVAIFLDFKRAFETIEPYILIEKLRNYGIGALALKWFDSYLSNRKQCVRINGTISNVIENKLGVPQGSILGPLLFIIYINEFSNILKSCKLQMFADDTLVYLTDKNIESKVDIINSELEILYNVINQNKLKLNIDKTKMMIITNKKNFNKSNLHIRINNETLQCEKEIKYLGVIIDDELKFKSNIDTIAKKVGRKVGVLTRLNNRLNLHQKIMLYKSIVEPHFNYCSSILFLSSKTDINRLQILQNKCLRNILRMKSTTSQSEVLNITELNSVNQIIFKNTMIFIFKIVKKIWPQYLCNNLEFKSNNPRKNTLRCKNELELNKATKACTQNSLFYKGIDQFNKLPLELKEAENLTTFITKIKKYVKTRM